ncbi:hypothetical protein [Amycolatopsis sp. NPDC051371]|uniref:hypothetical protein n=1 Tax=Amycolatopsis sp. NPDC051371 TaxID=3155800 RepID=UPI00344490ED
MNRAKVVEVRDGEAPAEVAEAEVGSPATRAEDGSAADRAGDGLPPTGPESGSPANQPGAGSPTNQPENGSSAIGPESGSPANEPGADSPTAGSGAGEAGADRETDRAIETESAEAADSEPTEGEAEAPAKPRHAWLRLPALLLAAALVLTGAGVWFTLEAHSAAGNPAAGNLALTDVGATADVTSAVTLAMNRIFSYSYDKTDVTEKAAAAVLRGSAKDSYDKLFAQVRQKAPEQKLVLTSRVSAIAVQELRNGHARLLVFLDQSAVRADNNATDSAAAQLSVTAERTGDGWVVTELEPR